MNPDALHDIVEPAAVSWTPQTVGWLLLAALVLLVTARWARLRYRQWQADAYRRAGLHDLERLRSATRSGISSSTLVALPALVKRVALAAAPREEVAGLSGNTWLAYLDRSYSQPAFTTGPGRLLPCLAYGRSSAVEPEELEELLRLIEDWIRTHRIPEFRGT